jgi:hypothetical protein
VELTLDIISLNAVFLEEFEGKQAYFLFVTETLFRSD